MNSMDGKSKAIVWTTWILFALMNCRRCVVVGEGSSYPTVALWDSAVLFWKQCAAACTCLPDL